MRHPWFGFALLALLFHVNTSRAQELLKTDGFGSLAGNVTFVGKVPPAQDGLWVIDPKTKAVQNVMIWVKPPQGTYFEIHPKFMVRNETIVIDQVKLAYVPRISAVNPVYFNGKKLVETGQKLIIRNSDKVVHNFNAIGHPEFNLPVSIAMFAETKIEHTFSPQLLPLSLQSAIYLKMSAKLFVFDHPYYAVTKADGTFEIPFVPAGAEVRVMSWHEGIGWVQGGKRGTPITIEKGKKHTVNIDLEIKI